MSQGPNMSPAGDFDEAGLVRNGCSLLGGWLDQLDLAQSLLEVVVGGDGRPLGLLARRNGARQRLDQKIRAEVQEEGIE